MSNDIIILIPAYQPTQVVIDVIEGVATHGSYRFVVVNDGSSEPSKAIFKGLSVRPDVTVLEHGRNLGKGRALKTGINHILVNFPEAVGIVTVDADGQHLPQDIVQVAKALEASPKSLQLGTRDFSKNTPIRSKFGNSLTQKLFHFFMRCNLADTQTGLRGLPIDYARDILAIEARGYEFEFEALIMACRQRVTINQIPIQTVYEDNNRGSHFSPIIDSLKIYFVFLRFMASSLVVSAIDTLAFSIVFYFSDGLLGSMVVGRVVAGLSQFLLSKHFVFNSRGAAVTEFLKYAALNVSMTTVSYYFIAFLSQQLSWNTYFSKILVESLLFCLSFSLQKAVVFKQKAG